MAGGETIRDLVKEIALLDTLVITLLIVEYTKNGQLVFRRNHVSVEYDQG